MLSSPRLSDLAGSATGIFPDRHDTNAGASHDLALGAVTADNCWRLSIAAATAPKALVWTEGLVLSPDGDNDWRAGRCLNVAAGADPPGSSGALGASWAGRRL
jgi:hypothetical protein